MQGAWSGVSASAHSGNNLVVLTDPRRQNAKALPALSRSAVANNSAVSYSAIRVGDDMETAALMGRWTGQTILATYENMLAHLRTAADSGKTPLGDHPTGQDWGGSPDLRAIMSTFKEFTPEMAVLTTVLELLFSRSAPLIQVRGGVCACLGHVQISHTIVVRLFRFFLSVCPPLQNLSMR